MNKVCIVTDFLLERNDDLNQLEVILGIFPNADIYTLSHQRGQIWGSIEERRIHSTFLSRLIKKEEDIGRWAFLIPNALKDLEERIEGEFCFIYSSGWMKPLKPRIDFFSYYFNSMSIDNLNFKSFRFKLFKSFLKSWQIKSEEPKHYLQFAPKLPFKKGEVLHRIFLSKDYPFITDDELYSQQNSIIMLGGENKDYEKISSWCKSKGLNLKLYGKDIVNDCSGVFKDHLSTCLSVISFEQKHFSPLELGAQCMGISLLKLNKSSYDSDEGVYYFDHDDLIGKLNDIFNGKYSFDRQKMRRHSLKFGGRQFKNGLVSKLFESFEQNRVREWMK